jgi:hypothetical protein
VIVPDDECQHPGAHKFANREDADEPIRKRTVLTGLEYEVKVCRCGYYHIMEVNA